MGRKKIQIARIADRRQREVTFKKRKQGLLKKAMELSRLCGCRVALIVIDEKHRVTKYSSQDLDLTLLQYTDLEGGEGAEDYIDADYDRLFGESKGAGGAMQTRVSEASSSAILQEGAYEYEKSASSSQARGKANREARSKSVLSGRKRVRGRAAKKSASATAGAAAGAAASTAGAAAGAAAITGSGVSGATAEETRNTGMESFAAGFDLRNGSSATAGAAAGAAAIMGSGVSGATAEETRNTGMESFAAGFDLRNGSLGSSASQW